MRRVHICSSLMLGIVLSAAYAAPYSQSFNFGTPAEQAEWAVTTNFEANGPGVPYYGLPDAGSVRIAPDGNGDKVVGDILLERWITAPAGYTFSNLVFSGKGQGWSSWGSFAELGISSDGSYLSTWPGAGAPASLPAVGATYAQHRASSELAEHDIVADASTVAALTDVSTFHLRIRIQDWAGYGLWLNHAPYARDLTVTGELTAVPEPTAVAGLVSGGLLMLRRRRI